VEVCTKFGGDWSSCLRAKEGPGRYVAANSLFYKYTSKPGPSAAREKFDELTSPIWTFFAKQSFGGRVGRVILVLRTFPEFAGRSVQNLVEIGPAVHA